MVKYRTIVFGKERADKKQKDNANKEGIVDIISAVTNLMEYSVLNPILLGKVYSQEGKEFFQASVSFLQDESYKNMYERALKTIDFFDVYYGDEQDSLSHKLSLLKKTLFSLEGIIDSIDTAIYTNGELHETEKNHKKALDILHLINLLGQYVSWLQKHDDKLFLGPLSVGKTEIVSCDPLSDSNDTIEYYVNNARMDCVTLETNIHLFNIKDVDERKSTIELRSFFANYARKQRQFKTHKENDKEKTNIITVLQTIFGENNVFLARLCIHPSIKIFEFKAHYSIESYQNIANQRNYIAQSEGYPYLCQINWTNYIRNRLSGLDSFPELSFGLDKQGVPPQDSLVHFLYRGYDDVIPQDMRGLFQIRKAVYEWDLWLNEYKNKQDSNPAMSNKIIYQLKLIEHTIKQSGEGFEAELNALYDSIKPLMLDVDFDYYFMHPEKFMVQTLSSFLNGNLTSLSKSDLSYYSEHPYEFIAKTHKDLSQLENLTATEREMLEIISPKNWTERMVEVAYDEFFCRRESDQAQDTEKKQLTFL